MVIADAHDCGGGKESSREFSSVSGFEAGRDLSFALQGPSLPPPHVNSRPTGVAPRHARPPSVARDVRAPAGSALRRDRPQVCRRQSAVSPTVRISGRSVTRCGSMRCFHARDRLLSPSRTSSPIPPEQAMPGAHRGVQIELVVSRRSEPSAWRTLRGKPGRPPRPAGRQPSVAGHTEPCECRGGSTISRHFRFCHLDSRSLLLTMNARLVF